MVPPPPTQRKRLGLDAYRIGWICSLPVELQAALAMLDEVHETPPQPSTDNTVYRLGSINGHNIALASLHQAGNCTASVIVTHMKSTFKKLKYGLLVGIGGGVPTATDAGMIRLGHVVVSKPVGIYSGGVNYSHGKARDGVFERTGYINGPPVALTQAAQFLDLDLDARDDDPIEENIRRILTKQRLRKKYKYPGVEKDHLHPETISLGPQPHEDTPDVVASLGQLQLEQRPLPQPSLQDVDTRRVVIHRGTIASGELLVRDAALRDKLAAEHGVLCFEMEAAGALTDFPCLVIRGISDYCDSFKNDDWHGFASAAAAAYARQLLFHLPTHVEESEKHRHFMVPFTQNIHFLGRESFLRELRAKLCRDNGPRRVAVTGLGGIGKTQIALQIAFWYRENRPRWSVFWLPAYSMNAFEKACLDIISEAGIQKLTDEDPKDAVRRYLNSPAAGDWLLIIDNADDRDVVFQSKRSNGINAYLPSNDNGRILFTSRFGKLAAELVGNDSLELKQMSATEAKDFLEKCLPPDMIQPSDPVQALLGELEYLPLAISQAASYLRTNRISVSIDDYLSTLRGAEAEVSALLSREFKDHTRYEGEGEGINHAVATTWLISFRQIEKLDDSGASVHLLGCLSQIEPTAIPLHMLPRPNQGEQDLHDALGTLASYAFLQRRTGTDLLDMHRLVHLATRIFVIMSGNTQFYQQMMQRCLIEIFPRCEWDQRETWRAYMPHALRLLEFGNVDEQRTWSWCMLAERAASCLNKDARRPDAIRLLEALVSAGQDQQKATTKMTLEKLMLWQHNLAVMYSESGQSTRALRTLEQVGEFYEDTLPQNHPHRLALQLNSAQVYLSHGKLKEGIQLVENIVEIQKDHSTFDWERWVQLLAALGCAYLENGQVEEAIPLLERASAMRKARLSEDHPELIDLQNRLAIGYSVGGRPKEAINLLEHVLKVLEHNQDENIGHVRNARNQLAFCYGDDNQLAKGIQLLETVLKKGEGVIAEGDRYVLSTQHILASLYVKKGEQLERAIGLLEHVVKVGRNEGSENEPVLLSSTLLLGYIYWQTGRAGEGIRLVEHVVQARSQTLDEGHPALLGAQRNLTLMYYGVGRTEEATQLFNHVNAVLMRREETAEERSRAAASHVAWLLDASTS